MAWVAESSRHLFLRALIRGQLCQPTYYMQSFSTAYSRPAVCGRPAAQHLLHRSRSVGPAAASEVALCGECLGYLPQRLPLSVQLAHQRDDFRNLLSVCGTGTALAPRLALDAGKPLEMLLGA